MISQAVLVALLVSYSLQRMALAAPMNPLEGHIEWPNELGAIFSSGHTTQSQPSHENWNTFASLEINPILRHQEQSQHLHVVDDPTYYSLHQEYAAPTRFSPEHQSQGHESEETHNNMNNHWPTPLPVYHPDNNLPFSWPDFDYNGLQQFEHLEQVHNPNSGTHPEEGSSTSISAKKKKSKGKEHREARNWKPDGSYKDFFPLKVHKLFEILLKATNKSESWISKSLTLHCTKEIGEKVLSGDPELLREAVRDLGLDRPKVGVGRRYDYLGTNTKYVTNYYSKRYGIVHTTAAQQLNESLDQHAADLILNPSTFLQGLDLVRSRRRLPRPIHISEPIILNSSDQGAHAPGGINTVSQNMLVNQDVPDYPPNLQYGGT